MTVLLYTFIHRLGYTNSNDTDILLDVHNFLYEHLFLLLQFHSDKTFDQKTNLQDERIDSSSEPIAMPYYTSVDNNDRRTVNNSKLSGSKAHTKKMPSTPERTVQAKDRQCEVEGTKHFNLNTHRHNCM